MKYLAEVLRERQEACGWGLEFHKVHFAKSHVARPPRQSSRSNPRLNLPYRSPLSSHSSYLKELVHFFLLFEKGKWGLQPVVPCAMVLVLAGIHKHTISWLSRTILFFWAPWVFNTVPQDGRLCWTSPLRCKPLIFYDYEWLSASARVPFCLLLPCSMHIWYSPAKISSSFGNVTCILPEMKESIKVADITQMRCLLTTLSWQSYHC